MDANIAFNESKFYEETLRNDTLFNSTVRIFISHYFFLFSPIIKLVLITIMILPLILAMMF